MTLTEDTKSRIRAEHESWLKSQYGDLTPERRKELGAVYTPAEITIRMIELYPCETLKGKLILDPACGSGNLLAACILAGADPELVYGNEYEASMVELCRSRLSKFNVPYHNIHQGDATCEYCLNNFGQNYRWPRSIALF